MRWLVKAHPAPDLFIAQVGDERDHDRGFRDPADDDASTKPGIGTRFAYPEIGGDLGGKAATALALAYRRTGDASLLDLGARSGTRRARRSGRAARPLRKAGYPHYAANFYVGSLWQDSLAAGAVELYRATCAAGACDDSYLADFRTYIAGEQSGADGNLGVVDAFSSFAAADACGAFGDAALPGDAGSIGCDLLRRERQDRRPPRARRTPSACRASSPGGRRRPTAAAARSRRSRPPRPQGLAGGCEVAAGARDYLLGRNPFGRSFVVGYGRRAAATRTPGPRSSAPGVPLGAVQGGPAPRASVKGQGFEAKGPVQQPLRHLRGPPQRLRHRRAGARLRGRLGAAARRAHRPLLVGARLTLADPRRVRGRRPGWRGRGVEVRSGGEDPRSGVSSVERHPEPPWRWF